MENKVITTTNGYEVTLAPFLTYDQFVEIQKLWTKDISIDMKTLGKDELPSEPENTRIESATIYDANKLTASFLIKKITLKGVDIAVEKPGDLPIPPIDGSEVMDVVKEISNEAAAAFDKKKVKK